MSSNANDIRTYASRLVDQARREGRAEVSILAGQVVRELSLNNRVPAVCSALASKRFQEQNGIVLERLDGPRSGQSTTSRFTYRLSGSMNPASSETSAFLALRGAGKDAFAALGGGEKFLKREREEFDGK